LKRFSVIALISTDNPAAVGPVLERWFGRGGVEPTERPTDFRVRGRVPAESAREANRTLLTELRRAERKTRLRAEWTVNGVTERFFDYVPKGDRRA
jgi:hypothetical protein